VLLTFKHREHYLVNVLPLLKPPLTVNPLSLHPVLFAKRDGGLAVRVHQSVHAVKVQGVEAKLQDGKTSLCCVALPGLQRDNAEFRSPGLRLDSSNAHQGEHVVFVSPPEIERVVEYFRSKDVDGHHLDRDATAHRVLLHQGVNCLASVRLHSFQVHALPL
jgi:hypothetical protein